MTDRKYISGFALKSVDEIPEIGGTLYTYNYEKTDTPLYFLKRTDDNKSFSIGFRTPPTDDTGVFHIIEHSVLCGSRKYPVKDPFSELLKGSVSTYLNAFTYPDRTVYPVSSKNPKAFLDLVSVYMDAVLHPLALTDPEIFYQEGYRLDYTDGELSECGVVFNEMQGAYSSHEELGEYHLDRLLYPSGVYSYDSGGNPDAIRTLTYEAFCEAHKKHYHPTNAVVFLDGDVDIPATLSLLDSYLSEYGRGERVTCYPLGAAPITEPLTVPYSEPDPKGEAHLYAAHRLPDLTREDAFALAIVCEALCDRNSSPLKRKILDTGACKNFYCYPSTSIIHPALKLEFRDVAKGREGELLGIYERAIDEILSEGVSADALRSAIDITEFKLREADYGSYPIGLVYMQTVMEATVKERSVADSLRSEKIIRGLREKIDTDYVTSLIRKKMKSEDAVSVLLTPDCDLEARQTRQNKARLKRLLESLSPEAREEIKAATERQLLRAATPDSEEARATLPTLTLEDIDSTVEELVNVEGEVLGTRVLYHPIPTSKISYAELFFDLSDIEDGELFALSLLPLVYGELNVGKDSSSEFSDRVKSTLGNLYLTVSPYKRGEEIRLCLAVRFSCLDTKRSEAVSLVKRYLFEANYNSPDIISRRINQINSTIEILLVENGNTVAFSRAAARYDGLSALKERLSGIDFLRSVRAASSNPEAAEVLPHTFEKIRSFFTRSRALISITGESCEELAKMIAEALPEGERVCVPPRAVELLPKLNEGIVISAPVSYAALTSNLVSEAEEEFRGSLSVLSTVMGLELLWEEIRIKGGAYDTGMIARANSGTVGYYSYRDPSPERSIEIFRSVPTLIREFLDTDTDLTHYIIGTIGAQDTLTTPRQKGEYSTACYLSGNTNERLRRLREETLTTDRAELYRLADTLERAGRTATFCVLASKERLAEIDIDNIIEL